MFGLTYVAIYDYLCRMDYSAWWLRITDALTKTNLPGRVDSGVVGTLRRMVINNQLEQPFRHSEADLLVLYMYDLFGHHSHAARGTLRNALQP